MKKTGIFIVILPPLEEVEGELAKFCTSAPSLVKKQGGAFFL
jgi:hypothetical protein